MDALELALVIALRDLLMPHGRGIVLRILSETLAAAAVTQMCDQGDMHKLSEMKAALLSDFEKDIDDTIQKAHEATFRDN